MWILYRYIGSQLLKLIIQISLILTGILSLGGVFQRSDLWVNTELNFGVFLQFVLASFPFLISYSLPWAVLLGTVLVYYRLTINHELTNWKMAGISLYRLSLPAWVIGLLFSIISFYFNTEINPRAKASYKKIINQQKQISPNRVVAFLINSPQLKLFINHYENEKIYGFHMVQDTSAGEVYLYSKEAIPRINDKTYKVNFTLKDAFFEEVTENEIKINQTTKLSSISVSLHNPDKTYRSFKGRTSKQIRKSLSTDFLVPSQTYQAEQILSHRNSISFACLIFSFVASPLGVKHSRKQRNGQFLMISLGLQVLYLGSFTSLENFEISSRLLQVFLFCLPNLILVIYGFYLHKKRRFN